MSRLNFNVNDVTYVGNSTISGLGVFASKYMSKGTILNGIDDDNYYLQNNFKRDFITLVNDGDMIYPSEWTYNGILKSFLSYNTNNFCNVKYCGDNSFILTKDVIKDEELTRKYSEETWIGWILLTVFRFNPFSDPVYGYPSNFPKSEDKIKEAKESLVKVIYELGYSNILENTLKIYQESLSVEDGKNTAEKFGSAILSATKNHSHIKI